MPLPDAGLLYAEIQVQGVASAQGGRATNTTTVYHFYRSVLGAVLVKSDVDTAFQAAIQTVVNAALNNTWTQQRNIIRWINDVTDPPISFTHINAGGVAGDRMPMHNAAFVRLTTLLRGKSNRGNKHFGPLSENDTTAGSADILNAGALVNFGNVATALAAGFTSSGGNIWKFTIVSRRKSRLKVGQDGFVYANGVANLAVNKRVGRMRRREILSVY